MPLIIYLLSKHCLQIKSPRQIANMDITSRHQSTIIPIRVGPSAELFNVHKAVLTKSEYFSKALDGDFKEADQQAIDLPEEDPAIFSFVVAYLYEGKFMPIKPISSVLGMNCFPLLKPSSN